MMIKTIPITLENQFQLLQEPVPEGDGEKNLRVVTYADANQISKILAVGEDPKEYTPLSGIEIEMSYPLTDHEIRDSLKILKKLRLIPDDKKVYDRSPIRDAVKEVLNKSPYLSKPVLKEQDGLEIPFLPMSLKAHHAFVREYKRCLDIFKLFKFDDTVQGYSIQINIDKKYLGENIKEQKETYAKFFWFLFNNKDLMCRLSGRRHDWSSKGDIQSLLGDKYGNMTEAQLRKVFLEEKEGALQALENSIIDPIKGAKAHFSMGTYTNKKGRPSFEWGMFHTSLEVNYLMGIIDFSYALFEWLKTVSIQETTFDNFYQFVRGNSKYPYIIRWFTSDNVYQLLKEFGVNINPTPIKKLTIQKQNIRNRI